MEDFRARSMRRARRRRRNQMIAGAALAAVVIVVCISALLIKKFMPSKERADISNLYHTSDGQIALILENQLYEKPGLYIDGHVYVDFETVRDNFNKRFYWDESENLVIYTTPTEVIKAEVGSSDYRINKSKKSMDHTIVKTEGDLVYLSLEYVQNYSNIEFQVLEEPDRAVISYRWGEEFLYATAKKKTQLRTEADSKSSIIADLEEGTAVRYRNTGEVTGKFAEVVTEDGLIGYVKLSALNDSYYDSETREFEEPEYTNISKDYTINMAWHQVTNQTANDNLLNVLSGTKGITTISPTWFSITSNSGKISSLASQTYVDRAHSQGVEVWALVDDFNTDVDMLKVLSSTSTREKLANELIAQAIKYNLDGINIDFERISLEAGRHYVQFLRELSIKCRNNGIVLSIDNYVPTAYSQYYDREEQGIIADYVIIMAYDEHNASSEEAGSVSSLPFFEEAVVNSLEMVPADKLIMAVPFYTRLWTEKTADDGTVKVTSKVYGMNGADTMLKDYGVEAAWDDSTGQYYAEFGTAEGTNKIWLEQEDSIEEKMKAIYNNKLAGVAAWKLGYERDSIWNIILKYVN